MNFKLWKIWFNTLPFSKKWFVVLILLRPIIDQFWESKTKSLYSPLQIIGVLFPIFVYLSISGTKYLKNEGSTLLKLLLALIVFNHIIIFTNFPLLENFAEFIRHITFILIFFYLMFFIKNENDFEKILQTFIYASFIPLLILIYEIIVGPIRPDYLSVGRGGGARYSGGYADIMTYAIYFIGSFGIVNYLFLKNIYNKTIQIKIITYVIFSIIALLSLLFIKHTASWTVFFMTLLLLLYYQTRKASGLFAVLILLVTISTISGFDDIFIKQINPLINKELNVVGGNANVESSFNGRMGRWVRYFGIWETMPTITIFTGVALSGYPESMQMVTGGMHNDFIRIFFLTGLVGLIIYLFYLFSMFRKGAKLPIPDKFILYFAILTIVLYSVSAVPSIYFNLQYLIMAIFVHAIKKTKDRNYVKNINIR